MRESNPGSPLGDPAIHSMPTADVVAPKGVGSGEAAGSERAVAMQTEATRLMSASGERYRGEMEERRQKYERAAKGG